MAEKYLAYEETSSYIREKIVLDNFLPKALVPQRKQLLMNYKFKFLRYNYVRFIFFCKFQENIQSYEPI